MAPGSNGTAATKVLLSDATELIGRMSTAVPDFQKCPVGAEFVSNQHAGTLLLLRMQKAQFERCLEEQTRPAATQDGSWRSGSWIDLSSKRVQASGAGVLAVVVLVLAFLLIKQSSTNQHRRPVLEKGESSRVSVIGSAKASG